MENNWNISKSSELYRLSGWGSPYFTIGSNGHLHVQTSENQVPLDLYKLTRSMERRGIKTPILFRFAGIVEDRLSKLYTSFDRAIEEYGYAGRYHLGFPVKVNQQRHVVDTVRSHRGHGRLGIEVGSKPELAAMLATQDDPDSFLLCNGYKDEEYIELALLNKKLGRRTIITVEQLNEVTLILKVSKKLDVKPEIGLRFKPTVKGFGRWQDSAGPKAKFGLTAFELVQAMNILKEQGAHDSLTLLHFHLGSQISSISALKDVLREAAHMYTELAREFPSMCFWDIGGGLAVDYCGSRSALESSMNYSMDDYALDVIAYIKEACDRARIPHPDIISESGRAVLAHHAVLVVEVNESTSAKGKEAVLAQPSCSVSELQVLVDLVQTLTVDNCVSTYYDLEDCARAVAQLFRLGQICLREHAFAQELIATTRNRIFDMIDEVPQAPVEIQEAREAQTETYFCNFSVFQSIPDSWAIGQLFPSVPLQKLDEQPTQKGVIADLTCDSDGKVNKFIGADGPSNALPLHKIDDTSPYYLGFFVVGAYQEILGDLHNLFGHTHSVQVHINQDGSFQIPSLIEGDSIQDVLENVQYDPEELQGKIRTAIDKGVKHHGLSDYDAAYIRNKYRETLRGYTYLVRHAEEPANIDSFEDAVESDRPSHRIFNARKRAGGDIGE